MQRLDLDHPFTNEYIASSCHVCSKNALNHYNAPLPPFDGTFGKVSTCQSLYRSNGGAQFGNGGIFLLLGCETRQAVARGQVESTACAKEGSQFLFLLKDFVRQNRLGMFGAGVALSEVLLHSPCGGAVSSTAAVADLVIFGAGRALAPVSCLVMSRFTLVGLTKTLLATIFALSIYLSCIVCVSLHVIGTIKIDSTIKLDGANPLLVFMQGGDPFLEQ